MRARRSSKEICFCVRIRLCTTYEGNVKCTQSSFHTFAFHSQTLTFEPTQSTSRNHHPLVSVPQHSEQPSPATRARACAVIPSRSSRACARPCETPAHILRVALLSSRIMLVPSVHDVLIVQTFMQCALCAPMFAR